MRRRYAVLTVMVVALLAAGTLSAKSNPFVGTWKLEVAKSKFHPGPAPKSMIRTWHPSGKIDVTGTNAEGKPISYGYLIQTDGKLHPTWGKMPNGAGSVSCEKINANALVSHFVRNGRRVETTKYAVSKDGKTMTIWAKGSTPTGKVFDNVLVWAKQ